ncbi:MAG: polymerase, sigma 54 subunit, RpoN [Firmicutes bacterium]|nr:polymerase, sigma 54 subunit, RpoN [Bacillota bacterium]
MRMDYGLKLEMNQKLIMTPQLQQAIAILQLSSMELAEMVEQELLENPVLEIEEKNDANTSDTAEDTGEDAPNDQLQEYMDWAEYFNEGSDAGYTMRTAEEKMPLSAYVSVASTLEEHLEFQMHLSGLTAQQCTTGKYLIGCIDDNGYLSGTVAEAAAKLGLSEQQVAEVLQVIQTFDPPGVGARSLKECLEIQAEQKGITDDLVLSIIREHLDEVGTGHLKTIAEKTGYTPLQVQKAVDVIRTLEPKPGRAFHGADQPTYIVPDVTIERVNGEYVIIINDNQVPHLTINPFYRHIARDVDHGAKKFVEGRINAAVWLIKSIEQRRRTLYNVVKTLISLQQAYFDMGPHYLKPLTMKEVANELGIHESTVSRAIANKYADTPHGIVALRNFFTAGLQGADGQALSASTVKWQIKEMVAGEDPLRPLSDQSITEYMEKKGITLSRRTVAKYREELGIPASSKRRRY